MSESVQIEAEFLKEMREREAQQIEAERQKKEQKAEKEKKKKEREAEKERKKKERETERERKRREKEVEKEKRMQERSTRRGRGQNKRQTRTYVPEKPVDNNELDEADDDCYCGECGRRYDEDVELWIGCDGGCEGWYHVICVGLDEESLPENFYCDNCSH